MRLAALMASILFEGLCACGALHWIGADIRLKMPTSEGC